VVTASVLHILAWRISSEKVCWDCSSHPFTFLLSLQVLWNWLGKTLSCTSARSAEHLVCQSFFPPLQHLFSQLSLCGVLVILLVFSSHPKPCCIPAVARCSSVFLYKCTIFRVCWKCWKLQLWKLLFCILNVFLKDYTEVRIL